MPSSTKGFSIIPWMPLRTPGYEFTPNLMKKDRWMSCKGFLQPIVMYRYFLVINQRWVANIVPAQLYSGKHDRTRESNLHHPQGECVFRTWRLLYHAIHHAICLRPFLSKAHPGSSMLPPVQYKETPLILVNLMHSQWSNWRTGSAIDIT